MQCEESLDQSPVLTAVRLPERHDADRFRSIVLQAFDMSLGNGLGKISGKVFRIGHLGALTDVMVCAGLSAAEMTMRDLHFPIESGAGVAAAQEFFRDNQAAAPTQRH